MFDFFDFIKDSGLVAVIGMLAVFFLTRSYDSRQQKDAFNERFFFDVYPRRLGVYEDVISGLQGMIETDPNEARDATCLDVSRTIIEKIHALDTLIARLSLFGSPRAIEFLKQLRRFMFDMQDKCVSNPLSTEWGFEAAISVSKATAVALDGFLAAISEETGNDFIENQIVEITKRMKKFPRKEDKPIQ